MKVCTHSNISIEAGGRGGGRTEGRTHSVIYIDFPLKLVIIQLECRPYCGWKKQGSCGGGWGCVLHVKRATWIQRDSKKISITMLTFEARPIPTRSGWVKYTSFRDSPSLGEGWVEISIFMPIPTRPLLVLCNVMGKGLHSSHSRTKFCSIIKDDSRSQAQAQTTRTHANQKLNSEIFSLIFTNVRLLST